MEKRTILVHLDTDPLPSAFDVITAIDSGIDHVLPYAAVTAENVRGIVQGTIFTRGPKELHRTAIFIGGSDVEKGEEVLTEVRKHFIPSYGLTVSVMIDSSGANTTAAAAVRAAGRHTNLNAVPSLVLGGTGPVGRRVACLLAKQGGHVRIGSRQIERAEAICTLIRKMVPNAQLEAVSVGSSSSGPKALEGRELIIAAGTPGAVLLPRKVRDEAKSLRCLIDLNGVPPAGIEGVELSDKGTARDGIICYGAIGIGGAKMKIHKAALGALFTRSDLVLDLNEIYDLAIRQQQ